MGRLFASAARRRITPSDELRALWNKSTPKPFSPPHGDIYVHALVLSDRNGQTLIHIGGDIISPLGDALRDRICADFNIPPKHLFLSSTHNHMVPNLRTPGATGPAMAFGATEGMTEWSDFVHAQVLDSLRSAMVTLRPAKIGAGHGVSGISVNREWDTPVGSLGTGDRNGDTLHEISVLRVDELDGKPIAVLVNSNCHAGSFYGGSVGLDHRITGGDVAGSVTEWVGSAIGQGVVPMWAIGGAGDQNTYFHSGMMWPAVDDKGAFFRETYIMKDEDAIKLARHTAAIQCMEALEVYRRIREFSDDFELKAGIVYKTVPVLRQGRGPGMPPGPPEPQTGPPQYDQATLRFYLITLNGIAFAGANTESFIGLKKAVRAILPYDEKFYIDMNSDTRSGSAGYVPAPRYDERYDQGRRHNLQGNVMPYNGNEVLRAFTDGFDELVRTIS